MRDESDMRKLYALVIVMLLCASAAAYITLNGKPENNYEYLYSLIQEEYGIELTKCDVIDTVYEPKYSRDFACVASIKLSDEYTHVLEQYIRDDASWLSTCSAEEIIAKYIDPALSSFENISTLRSCCMRNDSYIKPIVYKENLPYDQEFSILVVNTSDAELFYFTWK